MHNRCEGIFSLLVKASCAQKGNLNWFSGIIKKQPKLITSHVLSMDVMLSRGLEFGCHGQECWPHIFKYKVNFNVDKHLLLLSFHLNFPAVLYMWDT